MNRVNENTSAIYNILLGTGSFFAVYYKLACMLLTYLSLVLVSLQIFLLIKKMWKWRKESAEQSMIARLLEYQKKRSG